MRQSTMFENSGKATGSGITADKDGPLNAALITVEELGGFVGLVACHAGSSRTREILFRVQRDLSCICDHLTGEKLLEPSAVGSLETAIASFEASAGSAQPSTTLCASHARIAHAVCRRAEGNVVALASLETQAPCNGIVPPLANATRLPLAYLERLAALLLAVGHAENGGGNDTAFAEDRIPEDGFH